MHTNTHTCVFIPTLHGAPQCMPDWTVMLFWLSPVLSSNLSTFPSTLLLRCIWSTHFVFKIKIYSICNKNIESAHLRTSSHLKTAEHISNNKNSYDTSGTSQPPGRLRKEMRPLFIFCFKCLKKVPEIPGSTCFYLIKWEHRSLGVAWAKVTVSASLLDLFAFWTSLTKQSLKKRRGEVGKAPLAMPNKSQSNKT